jgi:putative peptide zinc metalloprotease protein
MLPSRWNRAAIGAAGMYVEIVLASICTFIWWFSEPGPLNYFCLNVMFVSSVSTVMFNANPLLRYDGYYILSDILEIPNLRQKASTILSRKLGKWCLGLEEPEDPFLPKRHQMLFALYTIASFLYRWVVLFGILYFLNRVFEPYGLKVLGQAIAMASIYGMFAMPAISVWKFFRVPGRLSKVKRWRLYTSVAVVAAMLSAIFLIPFPCRVRAPFELQPHDAASIYVEVPGRLVEMAVKPGDVVKKGQLIARLESLPLEMKVLELEGQRKSYQAQVDSLEQMRGAQSASQDVAGKLAFNRERLASVEKQLEKQKADLAKLTIAAPRDGTVIPPPRVPEQRKTDDVQLASWTGTPLDKENLGAHLSPEGQHNLLCQIGDPNDWDAVMTIDQNNFPIREGDEVRLMFEESAYHVFVTQISNWSADVQTNAPPRLASTNGGPLASKANPDGSVRPLNTSYQASARLDNRNGLLRNGLIGMARIETEPKTLAQRLYHYLSHTFNFEL